MANRFRGEVGVSVDGADYTLVMDLNAMIEFGEMMGVDPMKALEGAENGSMDLKSLRALIHASMLEHHPDATARDAGKILSDDPEIVARLIAAAAPEPEAAAGKTKAGAKRAA